VPPGALPATPLGTRAVGCRPLDTALCSSVARQSISE